MIYMPYDEEDKKKPDDDNKKEKLPTIDLSGIVMGYIKDEGTKGIQYINPMKESVVYLKIKHKGHVFNLSDLSGLNKLYKDFPRIYTIISDYNEAFKAQNVEKTNGIFIFKKVPIIANCDYFIVAIYDDKEYPAVTELGYKLLDGSKEIKDIIIPIPDEYAKGQYEGRKKDDPETDPKTVPPGVVEKKNHKKK